MNHHCHARNCNTRVPPKIFMCRRHWYMVPKPLRDLIWLHYRPGQEIDKNPTTAYLDAADAAIEAVAIKEIPGCSAQISLTTLLTKS